jgi:hypothetical protein
MRAAVRGVVVALVACAALSAAAAPAQAFYIFFLKRSQAPSLPAELAIQKYKKLIVELYKKKKKKKPPKIDPGKVKIVPLPPVGPPGEPPAGEGEAVPEDVGDELFEEYVELPEEFEWVEEAGFDGLPEEAVAAEAPGVPAGGPSAGSAGGGGKAAFPTPATTSAGVHVSVRQSVFDQDIVGDLTRTVRDEGPGYLTESMLSYEERTGSGVALAGQIAMRLTDDREIHGDGNRFRLEGEFFEAGRDGRWSVRVGDVVPTFSKYCLTHNALGVLASRTFEVDGGDVQASVVAAQTQRQSTPSVFQRIATGGRVARRFRHEGGAQSVVGVQYVDLRDVPSSITEPPVSTAFPDDEIVTVDALYDEPEGLHLEAEWGYATSRATFAGASARRRGYAYRTAVGYTHKGRSIGVEHERVDPDYDAPHSSASADLDRRAVTLAVPVGERLSIAGTYQVSYNDILFRENRSTRNRTSRIGVESRPFSGAESPLLRGLSLAAAAQFADDRSSDATTRRTGREMTYAIGESVGRLSLAYELKSARELDFVALENGRAPHHSTYQLSYEIPAGDGDRWKLRPTIAVGHDRDRNLVTGVVDRGSTFSAGIGGTDGGRSTFSLARDESVQRQAVAMRTSLSQVHRSDWTYLLEPDGDAQATLSWTRQENRDSAQPRVKDDRLQLALYGRW